MCLKKVEPHESITLTKLIEKLEELQDRGYGDYPVMFSDELELIHIIPEYDEVNLFKEKKVVEDDDTLFANTVHVWEEETLIIKCKLNYGGYNPSLFKIKKIKVGE